MPELVRRYHELHEVGLEVLAINLANDDRKKDIRRFADQFRLPFPVLLDASGKVQRRYALVGVPMTVFVDTAGVVAEVLAGPMTPRRARARPQNDSAASVAPLAGGRRSLSRSRLQSLGAVSATKSRRCRSGTKAGSRWIQPGHAPASSASRVRATALSGRPRSTAIRAR